MRPLPTARALLLAALSVGALVVSGCGSSPISPAAATSAGLKAIDNLPQVGSTIGQPKAPLTLTVLAPLTDFGLAQEAQKEIFPLVATDVRAGRLKIQILALSRPDDPDAEAAAQLVQAAGLQGRFWQAFAAFVSNYVGSLDLDLPQQVLQTARVPSVSQALAARSSPRVIGAVRRADVAAAEGNALDASKYTLTTASGKPTDVTSAANAGQLTQAVTKALGR